MELIQQPLSHKFELVPSHLSIGKIRGSKPLKAETQSIGNCAFKFKGFAVNLKYQQIADTIKQEFSNILVEFRLALLPDLSFRIQEIIFEGRLLSEEYCQIFKMQPSKIITPARIKRTELIKEILKESGELNLLKLSNHLQPEMMCESILLGIKSDI